MALVRNGVRARIATLDYPEHGTQIDAPGVEVVSVPVGAAARRLRGYSPALEVAIATAAADGTDVIHGHGLWMVPGIYARRAAVRSAVPFVISPRGMLDAWSLQRSPVRKRLAARTYERGNLRAAKAFHATSDLEARAIRGYGAHQPIAVVPNGVDLPDERAFAARDRLELRFPELRGRRWLVFMSRLHAKKGLDLLLDAWSRLRVELPNWHLVIAGPDLDGSRSQLERRIADDNLSASVTLTGMLEGIEKNSALANSELFVLPTRSENFGIAIAEALAHRIPVVTTTAAPWLEIVERRCGWWVAPESAAIEAALRSATALSRDELAAMGARGRELIVEKYTWDAIGRQMARVYAWIARGSPIPDCIRAA